MRRLVRFPALCFAILSLTLAGCSATRPIAPDSDDTDVYTADGLAANDALKAKHFRESIPLPVDFMPEGIADGKGSTFYVGSLRDGDIYRGDLRTGAGRVFIDAPAGRHAVGMKVDPSGKRLFVAGGPSGAAYVYDAHTGRSLAEFIFAPTGATLLNDVILTRDAAYFTDSFRPVLYRVAIGPGPKFNRTSTITLKGPAAFIDPASPNLNGVVATPNGKELIVNHTALGALFVVDPSTGASRAIDVDGLQPGVMDGMLLEGRSLWIVENFANKLVRVTLSPDLSRGTIAQEITSPLFRVPTTVARVGGKLALVNARFDLGLPPPFGPGQPPGTEFDVVVVRAR